MKTVLRIALLSCGFLLCTAVVCAPAGAAGWRWQNPLPQGNDLNGVSFVDAQHGWAVGNEGTILVTRNGGVSWSPQESGTGNDLRDVVFLDRTHGYACGEHGAILSTVNGGATWSAREPAVRVSRAATAAADS